MFDKFTVILLMGFMALPASAEPFVKESAFWAVEVENGDLDPAPLRIPQTPLIWRRGFVKKMHSELILG